MSAGVRKDARAIRPARATQQRRPRLRQARPQRVPRAGAADQQDREVPRSGAPVQQEPGPGRPKRTFRRDVLVAAVVSVGATLILGTIVVALAISAGEIEVTLPKEENAKAGFDPKVVIALSALVYLFSRSLIRAYSPSRADRRYEEARTRVQDAEDALQSALESQDRKLALQRIWGVVHERLEQYHQDAQRQGRIAFSRAMGAMAFGFAVLSGCVVVMTFFVTSDTGVVVTGILGAVGAGVAGYVSKTYLRAYQESATHLRAYFAQPVEASRFLFAERAVAVSGLPGTDRAELMKVLVHAMVTGELGTTKTAEAP